jgi:hypothetical protein
MTDKDMIRRGDVRKALRQLFVDAFAGRLNDDPVPIGIIDRIPAVAPRPMKDAPRDGTKVLAWWPPVWTDPGEWASTWWQRGPSQVARWETLHKFSSGADVPTRFLPHPPEGGSDA